MLIVLEGVDGSGKTTVAKLLAERLGGMYQSYPDRNTPTGKVLQKMMGAGRENIDPVVFQALQTVNRLERFSILQQNMLVVDRYYQSGLVYGVADGCDPTWLGQINKLLPYSALNILMLPSPEVCYQRNVGKDIYGARSVEELRALQASYIKLWKFNDKGCPPGTKLDAWWHTLPISDTEEPTFTVDRIQRLVDAYQASRSRS